MGLARRAARKLVPVVLTLGSGPSGFPRNLSGRRPKLPRQPRRGRVARARSRNFDAGSWPVGLLETTFRATAEASATAMANPRRRTRALRYFGAGGWPVGLPETIFRATAKASATASLALASVVLALGVGPTGFPKQVSERCKAVISALGAGPSGFSKQLSIFWRWGLARRASRNNFPGDGQSFCDSLPRARFRRFGAGGWPDGLPETSFRAMQSGGILDADSHGKPAPSHARAPLFRRWGLARRASRNKFPSDAKRGDRGGRRGICGPKPMSQHGRPRFSRARARPVAAMAVLSTRSGQMARSLASGCGWPISYCPV